MAVVLGAQPVQAWLWRDVLVRLREPRAATGVWACVGGLGPQRLEVIRVELTVWPGGNFEADNLIPVVRGLKHCS